MVDALPSAVGLPLLESAPAGHSAAAAQLLREHLPGDAALEHKENAGDRLAVRDARATSFGPRGGSGGRSNSRAAHKSSSNNGFAIYHLATTPPVLLDALSSFASPTDTGVDITIRCYWTTDEGRGKLEEIIPMSAFQDASISRGKLKLAAKWTRKTP